MQYPVCQVGAQTPCHRSLTQWSLLREPGISAECHLLLSQPSAPRRHPEEEMPSTCIALRTYDFCPKSRRPGINFFLGFWRCRVLGWMAVFWASDKGKGEQRTATHYSCLCTRSLSGLTLAACIPAALVLRWDLLSFAHLQRCFGTDRKGNDPPIEFLLQNRET